MFTQTAPDNTDQFSPYDWTLFLTISVLWGASFALIDIGLDSLAPGVITFGRIALGALTLRILPTPKVTIASGDRRKLGTLAIVWVALPFTLFPLAEQHINSATTGLLNGGMPIVAALVATFLVRQPPTRLQTMGITIGFLGIAGISLPSITSGANQALGVLLVLGAIVSYGFAINMAAPLQQKYGSVALMAKMLAVASAFTFPFALPGLANSQFAVRPVLAVAALGILGTGAAFAVMASLVGRVGATRASFITYLIPVVSLVLGVLLRGDSVAPLALVGVVLVILGAVLASRSPRQDRS